MELDAPWIHRIHISILWNIVWNDVYRILYSKYNYRYFFIDNCIVFTGYDLYISLVLSLVCIYIHH